MVNFFAGNISSQPTSQPGKRGGGGGMAIRKYFTRHFFGRGLARSGEQDARGFHPEVTKIKYRECSRCFLIAASTNMTMICL